MREFINDPLNDKKVIFSDENIGEIENLSKNILNYVALIRLLDYDIEKESKMVNSDGIEVFSEFIKSYRGDVLKAFSNGKNMLDRALEDINVRKIYRDLRKMILVYGEKISMGNSLSNPEKNFEIYFKSELVLLAKIDDIVEELDINIKRYSLGDELSYIIGEEFDYEFDSGVYGDFDALFDIGDSLL